MVGAVLLVGCSSGQAATTTVTAPASTVTVTAPGTTAVKTVVSSVSLTTSSSATTSSATADPPAVQKFAELFAAGDRKSLGLIKPGTKVYTYVEGSILLEESSNLQPYTAVKADNGWTVSSGVTLSNFKLDQSGKIINLTRNGIAIDKLVSAGDGKTYVAEKHSYDTWTGSVTVQIHSFRDFDGLYVEYTIMNKSSARAYVDITGYAAGGKQYTSDSGVDPTLPSITRSTIVGFTKAPTGGHLYLGLVVDTSTTKFELDIPKLS